MADENKTTDPLAEITARLNGLTERVTAAVTTLESGDATTDQVAEVKALIEGDNGLQAQINVLTEERNAAMREAESKAMKGRLETLEGVIADLRKPSGEFTLHSEGHDLSVVGERLQRDRLDGKAFVVADDKDPYFITPEKKFSVYNDIRLANKGIADARDRLTEGFEGLNPEGKAMTEGTAAQGGYLVRPQIERQLVEARELDNILRALCSKLNVTTNSIQLDQLGLSTTAGWVAELATKVEGTAMTLATVTANVFTAAGLATISNQLLADSNPAVDGLVTADLAKRLVALEEAAFIAGTGTGQPLGILNTPGIGATPLTSVNIVDLLDAILDSIANVETNHGAPSAILMHPRTWTRILKSKDAQGAYYIDPAGGPQDPRTGLRGPVKSLWGYRVVTSNRVPINLGAGTNESRVIVGDFSECLILDRQGITVDESKHVYFTTNQTVFRAEQRVGFTAARTPAAINVVGGVGLANG